jgi:ATP-binding cassette subfamily G (WHITE) protein 2
MSVRAARRIAGGVCPITSGEQTIAQLDLDQLSIGADAGILCVYILICRLIAFLGIRYIKW